MGALISVSSKRSCALREGGCVREGEPMTFDLGASPFAGQDIRTLPRRRTRNGIRPSWY